jgi:hypothetical protein
MLCSNAAHRSLRGWGYLLESAERIELLKKVEQTVKFARSPPGARDTTSPEQFIVAPARSF